MQRETAISSGRISMPITLPTERPISGYINAITRNAETLHNNGKQVSRITLRKNGKGQIALQRRRLHGLTSLRQHRQHVASPTKLSRTDPRDGDVAQENLPPTNPYYVQRELICYGRSTHATLLHATVRHPAYGVSSLGLPTCM